MAKYIGPDGYEYSLEELNNMGNNSSPSTFTAWAGRNLQPQESEEKAQHIAGIYRSVYDVNPDQEARKQETANILGMDGQSLSRASNEINDMAEATAKAKINSPDDWKQFVEEYPKTANYLSSGKNMSMSHDDINALSETERTIKNTVRLGELNKERSQLGMKMFTDGRKLTDLDHEERRRIDMLDNELRTLQSQLPQTTWSAQGLLSGIVGMAEPMKAGVKGAGIGAAAGLGAGAVTGVGALATAATGAGWGFRVGMADEFAATAMGNSYLDSELNYAKNSNAGAMTTGVATAALGMAQVGKWLKVPTDVGLKHLGLTTVEQAMMGAGFAASDVAGRKVATDKYNLTEEDLKAIAMGGIDMIPIGLALSSPSYGIAGLRRLGEVADNSKTKTRNPQLVADKINNEVKGTELEHTAISGEALETYLGTLNPAEAEGIMTRLNITPDALAEALITGSEVRVDAGNFAILESAVREKLLPDTRTGNHFTENEIASKKAELDEALKQVREQKDEPTEQPSSIADDLGLRDVKEYAEADGKGKSEKERLSTDHEEQKNVIEQNKEYQDRMEEVRKQVEEEVSNDPVHLASDALKFDLQMFNNAKDVKDIAKKYQKGKMSEAEKLHFEDVAEGHKLTGKKLAEEILHGKTKENKVIERMKQAEAKLRDELLGTKEEVVAKGETNESNMKKIAMEAEALSGIANGEHKKVDPKKQEEQINQRWKDAEQKLLLDIEKAKGQEEVRKLQEQLTELKKQHAEEIKQHQKELEQNARWRDAEQNKETKDRKEQGKHDKKLAKEWLKAESVAQWIARNSEISIQAAKEMAKAIIASKTIAELRHMGAADWKNYFKLAKQAKVNSERAYRKGKYGEAAKYKKQELLNHALAMEAMQAEKEIKRVDKGLKKFIKRGTDLLGMPVKFMGQIDKLLKDYGLIDKEPVVLPGETMPGLKQFVIDMQNEYHPVPIPESILFEAPKNHNFITLDMYKDLYGAVSILSKMGKRYEHLSNAFNRMSIKEAAKEIMETILNEVGDKYAKDMLPGSAYKSKAIEKIVNVTRLLDKVIPSMVNTLTVCKFLDGGKDNGPMQRYFYNALKMCEDKKIARMDRVKQEVGVLLDDYYGKSGISYKQRNEKIFEHLGRYYTKEEILMFGMNWGNEGNRDRIMGGFKWLNADGSHDYSKVKPILEQLTKKDWDFCQKIWNYLDTFWPEIQKLEMEVAGNEPKRVSPSEFTAKGETYKGGYFPIAYDYGKAADVLKTVEQKNALYKQQSATHAMTDHGHTEARSQHNDKPVMLSMDVFFQHLENIVHDLSFREGIIDANRILNSPETKTAIVNALGIDSHRFLEKWLQSIASDQREHLEKADKTLRWFRYAATYAGMGLRVSMFPIDSVGNFVNATWEIGPTRMIGAIKDYALHPKDVHDLVVSNSEYMKHRTMIRERDLWDISKKWYGKDSGLKNFAFATMAWSDQLISFPMWAEVYNKEIGAGKSVQNAINIADNKIKRTVGSGSILDQVGVQKGSELKKITSMFYSWCSMMFNRMWLESKTAGVQWDKGNKAQAIGTMSKALILGVIMPGLTDGLIREAMRNEPNASDDDKKKRLASRMLGQPISYWWLARDVGQFAINKTIGTYSNYTLSPIETQIESIVNTIPATMKYASGYLEGAKYAEQVSKAVSYMGFYPQQLNAWAFNFIDFINGKGEPVWQDLLTRRVKKKITN